MSITNATPPPIEKELRQWIARGSDPRKYRLGLAEAYNVPVETIDRVIESLSVPDKKVMDLRYRSRVYGSYDPNPRSEHDED